jgi:hypothetical protein
MVAEAYKDRVYTTVKCALFSSQFSIGLLYTIYHVIFRNKYLYFLANFFGTNVLYLLEFKVFL